MLTKEQLLDRLFRSPIVQDEIKRAESELDQQRKAAAAEIEWLEKEAAKELPKLHAAKEEARERAIKLATEAQAAKRTFMVAELASLNAGTHLESAIGEQRSFLHETAPAIIGQYLTELLSLANQIRAEHVTTEYAPVVNHDPFVMNGGKATLAARHARHQTELEVCQLISSTISLVKSMFTQPLTEAQAADDIAAHKRCIAAAMTRAGLNLN